MARKPRPIVPLNLSHRFSWPLAILIMLVVSVVGVEVIAHGFAATGTLSFVASTTTPKVGQTFTVNVMENSGTDIPNAVEADITYPAALLTLDSVDSSKSAFTVAAVQNTAVAGTIQIARGNTPTTSVTGSQLVSTLTFTAKSNGSAALGFLSTSALVRQSDNSNILVGMLGTTITTVDATPPSVPTGLTAQTVPLVSTSSSASIALSWTAATDNVGVTGYTIYRNGTKIATTNGLSFTDANLPLNTTYTYSVSAYDAAGNASAQSATVSVATVKDTFAPTTPTNVALAHPVTPSQVVLTWTVSTDNVGVTGYIVKRNGVTLGSDVVATNSYTDATVVGGTSYTYTVSAEDAAGNISAPSTALAVIVPSAVPTTPTNVTVTYASGKAVIAWSASTSAGSTIKDYVIYRNKIQIATSTSLTYSDAIAIAGVYSYTVAAVNTQLVSSSLSNAVTVTIFNPSDLNKDGSVGVLDLSILISNWGKAGGTGDINNDGTVDVRDLSILLSNWTNTVL